MFGGRLKTIVREVVGEQTRRRAVDEGSCRGDGVMEEGR